MRRPKTPATLEAIARKLDGLFSHVESLDRSVGTLAERIQPFDDEEPNSLEPTPIPLRARQAPATLDGILQKISAADDRIDGMERDMARIRSLLEGIDGDHQLRDELRPYFKKRGD